MLGPSYSFELQGDAKLWKPVRLSDGLLAGGVGPLRTQFVAGSSQASRVPSFDVYPFSLPVVRRMESLKCIRT